jgi:3-phenylpropionate/cinnamic acid dioxygenase small subunit
MADHIAQAGSVYGLNKGVIVRRFAYVLLLALYGLSPALLIAGQIEDHMAIERLLVEYGRTLDNRDFAAYSHLFAQNGEWKGAQGAYKGPAAIQAAMEKIFTAAATDIPKGQNFHVMSNFIIDVQGNRATASSLFIFYKMNKGKPEPTVAGRYEDILMRENGVWRFLQRTALPPG